MSNRVDNDRIHEELTGISYKELKDFEKNFPYQKDNVYNSWFIEILTKEFFENGWDHFYLHLSGDDPYNDFWKRWNRWKNLRAFL
jgi:hypothetical protein